MPYFRVMLCENGIDIPSDEGLPSIVGFYTTRLVRALTIKEAEDKANKMVLSEWSSGIYAKANKGSLPVLSIEAIYESNFWDSLRFKNKGYTFFPRDNGDQTDVKE